MWRKKMMPIGNDVIYMGKVWNNQIHGVQPVFGVKRFPNEDESVKEINKGTEKSFAELLADNLNKVNDDQIAVTKITEKLITNPDEVEVHEVIITMEKAKQSLDVAHNVIDRVVQGWNELKSPMI